MQDDIVTDFIKVCSLADEKARRNKGPGLFARRADEIEPKHVDWLWRGRIARGKQTCIAGEPGTGKSQLSIAIVAAITTGGEWPCGEGRAPLGNVIILSAEDSADDTIVPRLMAARADRGRVEIVSAVRDADGNRRAFNLQTDISLLEQKIAETGNVALVVIDPVSSYLGKADSHKNAEVRGVLAPLTEMAERAGVAVLSITHFAKPGGAKVAKALHRFIGSIAFTGAPRAAFAVIEDAENQGRYFFLHGKNNLAPPPQGLAYRLEQEEVADGLVASRIWFESEPVETTANEAMSADMAGGGGQRSALAAATEFLQDLLAVGGVAQEEIKDAAEGNGHAWATVRRAKELLGVEAIRETDPGAGRGAGRWIWRLKDVQDAQNVQDAHVER
jgi:AAA domain